MSISSMPMPYASTVTSSTLSAKDTLEPQTAETDTATAEKKEKDDEDFVVIESMVPTPSDVPVP